MEDTYNAGQEKRHLEEAERKRHYEMQKAQIIKWREEAKLKIQEEWKNRLEEYEVKDKVRMEDAGAYDSEDDIGT